MSIRTVRMNAIVQKLEATLLPPPFRQVIVETQETTLVGYLDNLQIWRAVSDGRVLQKVIRWRLPDTAGFLGSIPA